MRANNGQNSAVSPVESAVAATTVKQHEFLVSQQATTSAKRTLPGDLRSR